MNGMQETRQETAPETGTAPRPAAPPPPEWTRKGYYAEDPRRKSPALATLLSMMPGLGQVYVGYYQQGFINVLVVGGVIALLAGNYVHGIQPLAGMFLGFFWLYNLVDAGRKAALYNQMLVGLGPTQLPEDIKAPGGRGSLAAGVALFAFGLLMLAHTRFGLDMHWVEDWWPAGLVIAGGYLIYKSVAPRLKGKTA
jgi:hypothetical protein